MDRDLAVLRRLAPFEAPDAFWAAIATGYATPPRHYHTLAHVREVARAWAAIDDWVQPAEVFAAILLHDVVYEAGWPDNEARSAALAEQWLPRWLPHLDLARVAALIRLTASHGHLANLDADAARFLDADMAVLGADRVSYARYAAGVRAEYAPSIGTDAYDLGRAAFLDRLLAAPRLFLSDGAHAALDAPARANLRAERDGALPRAWSTGRLHLTPVGPGDEAGLLALAVDPHVVRYLFDGEEVDEVWAEAATRASAARFAAEGLGLWLAAGANGPIGFAGFVALPGTGLDRELVVALVGAAAGQGLGRELAAAMLDEARRRGVAEVQASVDDVNAASVRLLIGAGFARVGATEGAFGSMGIWRRST